jgi:hypothetical protein
MKNKGNNADSQIVLKSTFSFYRPFVLTKKTQMKLKAEKATTTTTKDRMGTESQMEDDV